MRKIILFVICCCMLWGLVACGNSTKQNKDATLVNIINASAEEIYGIGYTYYVDGNVICSGGICNADNSAIKVRDEFSLEKKLFEERRNIELKLSVVDKVGKEYLCSSKILLNTGRETPCEIEVTGDYQNGFDVWVKTN